MASIADITDGKEQVRALMAAMRARGVKVPDNVASIHIDIELESLVKIIYICHATKKDMDIISDCLAMQQEQLKEDIYNAKQSTNRPDSDGHAAKEIHSGHDEKIQGSES